MRKFESLLGFIIGLGIFSAILFWVLRASEISVGTFVDWIIGFATASWLLTVTTIPWNIHFEAKTVLHDAQLSRKKDIKFDESELHYVHKVARNALFTAVLLHLVSAVGLYLVAHFQVSVVGYYGCGAAILLTFLRPAMRMYQYISERLSNIRFEVKYPRDDVYEVSNRVANVEVRLEQLTYLLNQEDKESWISTHSNLVGKHQNELKSLQKRIEDIREMIQTENERVLKETQKAVAQVNQEGKFVDKFVENLVEIVRFIKRA